MNEKDAIKEKKKIDKRVSSSEKLNVLCSECSVRDQYSMKIPKKCNQARIYFDVDNNTNQYYISCENDNFGELIENTAEIEVIEAIE